MSASGWTRKNPITGETTPVSGGENGESAVMNRQNRQDTGADRQGRRGGTANEGTVAEYIRSMLASERMRDMVVFHKRLPSFSARYADPSPPFPPSVSSLLASSGIPRLYAHQVRAIGLVREGRHVVVATPTASGKSLIYNLPVLESLLLGQGGHALYLFPLKALAQDQIRAFRSLAGLAMPSPTAAIYDGDTTPRRRKKLRESPPNVLFTNPEMLHLGLLAFHHNWAPFFAGLKYVVIDEVHTYRGVMGSNMALVFSRLRRVCEYHGSSPVFLFSSATIANPAELASRLTGLDVALVDKSAAPAGPRHFVFLNPPDGPVGATMALLRAAMHRGLRSIVYTQSRKMAELIALWASSGKNGMAEKISAYRAGYLPEERREIEARLKSGDLLTVVSTSALELGIDIGGLDLCILVGYPGTVMATLQRGGRVGRDLSESAVVLVAGEDALDQYFMRNPKDFFARGAESANINPENPILLAKHLVCAAHEVPLAEGDILLRSEKARRVAREMEASGGLLRDAEGGLLHAGRKRPHQDVDLRGGGLQYSLVRADTGETVGRMDRHRVYYEAHPGAVYLHLGQSFKAEELCEPESVVRVLPAKTDYYTRARSSKQTEILEILDHRKVMACQVFYGGLQVTDHVTGYEKRRVRGGQSLGVFPLDLPPCVFETTGIWFVIPEAAQRAAEDMELHFMGGIHAIEHAAIGIVPVIAICDRNDLGGISTPYHLQAGRAAVFMYDALPGGAGLAWQAFRSAGDLLRKTHAAVSSCKCDFGCPSCVHSPKCGSGNRPIDKAAAVFLLERLMGMPQRPGLGAPQGTGRKRPLDRKEPGAAPPRIPTAGGGARQMRPEGGMPVVAEKQGAPSMETNRKAPREKLLADRKKETPPMNQDKGVSPGGAQGGSVPVKDNRHYGVFDLETQNSAEDVGGWGNLTKMRVSCAVLYDSREDRYFEYLEEDVPRLVEHLKGLPLVIGFNVKNFDYNVLKGYTRTDFRRLNTLDLLESVRQRLGYRLSLDHLATHTLGAKKTANGLEAIKFYREGRIAELVAYCRVDVELTRDLYLYGRKHGYVLFENKSKKRVRCPVEW
jgi:DEAD/DEAH box helicase domain-containing protein